jgi:hypothetical protein
MFQIMRGQKHARSDAGGWWGERMVLHAEDRGQVGATVEVMMAGASCWLGHARASARAT